MKRKTGTAGLLCRRTKRLQRVDNDVANIDRWFQIRCLLGRHENVAVLRLPDLQYVARRCDGGTIRDAVCCTSCRWWMVIAFNRHSRQKMVSRYYSIPQSSSATGVRFMIQMARRWLILRYFAGATPHQLQIIYLPFNGEASPPCWHRNNDNAWGTFCH
jgi:hypothetical protein